MKLPYDKPYTEWTDKELLRGLEDKTSMDSELNLEAARRFRELVIDPEELIDLRKAVDDIAKEHSEGVLPNHRFDPSCRICCGIRELYRVLDAKDEGES